VFETPAGAESLAGQIATHVNFDAEAARALVERFGIINLPTVVVLGGDGQEIDRVQGYEEKDAWLEEMSAALRANNPIPTLEERARTHPDDAAAQLELGWRLLVRGDVARGEVLLERAILLDADDRAGHASEALFVLGRFYQRVKLDFRTGRNIWRELATRYPRSERALTALSWWAKAEAELGHVDLGAEILRRAAQAEGATPDHVVLWASYARKRGVDRQPALAAVDAVLPAATGETAEELRELREALSAPAASAPAH